MPRTTTQLLFLSTCLLAGRTHAQCTVAAHISVYATCYQVSVQYLFNFQNVAPPYQYTLMVNGVQYQGSGSDPYGFSYQIPWGPSMSIGGVSGTVIDANGCTSQADWGGTFSRLDTPVEYSKDLDCSTGQWTFRWTNADEACGNAGDHLMMLAGSNGQVSSFCTQESPSVWRFNTPLNPSSPSFALDYLSDTGPVGYYCAEYVLQCWYPDWVQLTLPYVQPGDCGVNFQLNAALQGPMGTNGIMSEALRTSGLVPLTEPYSALGYTYTGSPSLAPVPAYWMTTNAWAIVDWDVVELRSALNPATVVYSRPVFFTKNGRVRDKNFYLPSPGTIDENLNFPVAAGNYYIAIRHRDHLGIMTAAPVALDDEPELWDLRLAGTAVYGTNARVQAGGYWCLWAGDASGNGAIKYTGSGNDRDPILTAVGSTSPNNTVSNVYDRRDTNLDGVIKYTGSANDRDIILNNVGGATPNNTRTQQLP